MKKVLVIGGTTFDSIVYLKELPDNQAQTIFASAPLHETVGSTGAGKALNLVKLGVDTILHSVVGSDEYGDKIIDRLKAEGVPFIYDLDPLGTERHVNLMSESGQRISIFATRGSEQPVLDLVRLEQMIIECDIIVLNIISYTKQLIHLIKKYNKPIWIDLHDYKIGNPYHDVYIEAADYIFLSSDNLPEYKEMMNKWVHEGKELVVCTHGKKGASALNKKREYFELSIVDEFELKDANGAGDSFFAGFLYAYLKGYSLINCMNYATLTAGLCINSYELFHEQLSSSIVDQLFDKHYANI